MENRTDNQPATQESVWAAFSENERLLKESRVEFGKSIAESRAEFEKSIAKSRAEFEKSMAKSRADSDRRMKKIEETLGAWANNHGDFAEEYFFNSFENGKQTFFGERFDRIEKNLKPLDYEIKDEYDIVLVNGKSVAIIEVKFKAHEHDVPKVLSKVNTFRANYPRYLHHRVYLGLASLSFYPSVEQECKKQGIAIIKQVGNMVIINDAYLKVF